MLRAIDTRGDEMVVLGVPSGVIVREEVEKRLAM
jgi:hypothetical protein